MSVLQLMQSNATKREAEGKNKWAFLRMVPSATALENWSYRINAVAFAMWTFTLVAGAIWAEAAWGRYWNWDTKEVWTSLSGSSTLDTCTHVQPAAGPVHVLLGCPSLVTRQ